MIEKKQEDGKELQRTGNNGERTPGEEYILHPTFNELESGR
jgi:hypothetical protein